MQKLILIMGYQRSGTNALFNSLSRGGECIPILDSEDSDVYDEYYLRPEADIRTILSQHDKPVLLKPVNETKKRNIDSVLDEYSSYDVRVLYIYRDPVNSFFSQTEMWPEFTDVDEFIEQWNMRNRYAVNISSKWKPRLALVKYQDLSDDPRVFDDLCDFAGVRGIYLFRGDKNRGRQYLDHNLQQKIDEGTRETMQLLDESRTFLPKRTLFSLRKIYRNSRFFLIQQLRKLQVLPQ
jgi:hypothetical protein